MQSKSCNAILSLKPPVDITSDELLKNTLECMVEVAKESNKKIKNTQVIEENKDLDETDLNIYLSQNKDNIVLIFGQKINLAHRNELKKNLKKVENVFYDDKEKKYFQINGRHLVDEDDIKAIKNSNLSIYNISTLKNVVRVNTKDSPVKHSRSVYSIESYTKDDYNAILNE